MRAGWDKITWAEANEVAHALSLVGITWTTLDSRWYFREIEWADEEKTRYAFPGSAPVMIKHMPYYGGDEYAEIDPAVLAESKSPPQGGEG